MMNSSQKQTLFQLLSVLLMVVALYASFYYWRGQRMSSNWMGPFLSAAQHLHPGERTFLIDVADVQAFRSLGSVVQEDSYVFCSSATPVPLVYDPVGYAYLIRGATLLFPFVGHQLAIILFQSFLHVLLCFCLLSNRELSYRSRILFLVFYALNPLVLRLVTFNFYYFWQVIPSFGLLFVFLNVKSKVGWLLVLMSLPLVVLARSTTLFITAAFLVFLFRYRSRLGAIVYALFLAGLLAWLYVPNLKNPWHTMYAGAGGYSNPDHIILSDESSYALYQKHTGVPISASVGGNFYIPAVQEEYTAITRQEYLALWKKFPLLLVKNALAYFCAAFSVGYVNKAPEWLNYSIAASGLAFLSLLLYHRKYRLVLCMTLGIGAFIAYYPPIPAYMYGNYLLLAWGLIELADIYFPSRSTAKTRNLP